MIAIIFQLQMGINQMEGIMAKSMKLHIDNDGKNYVCGLKIRKTIPEAVFDKNTLIELNTGEPITYNNINVVCRNCIKLFHPTYLNDQLIKKELDEYKASLPKSNRERAKRNSMKRRNRNKALKTKALNVIQLPFVPVPNNKPISGLLVDYNWRNLDKQAKIIEKPKQSIKNQKSIKTNKKDINNKPIQSDEIISIETKTNELYEDAFIQFNEDCAMVRGFDNYWKVIIKNNDGTIEDLSNWLEYDICITEAKELGLKVA